MIKLSNTKFILIFLKLLVLLLVAKIFSLLMLWYLPSDGVEISKKENYQPKYQRVDFKNMLTTKNTQTKVINEASKSNLNIKNMLLKALYGNENNGFVIVAKKSNLKKTYILAIGENIEGYTLKTILIKSAIFNKNGRDFTLNLNKIKNKSAMIEIDDTLSVKVSRNDITYYTKNPKSMWKDISIKEVRDGKNIKGFKVNSINLNSKLAKLGLKKGDLIIKANNVKLRSYTDALNIYNNINKLDMIQIVVIRNNQEVELVYEIN